jgi:6-pyruvoyltetrahydropterin/6-carboxytetrahydropterin synthase
VVSSSAEFGFISRAPLAVIENSNSKIENIAMPFRIAKSFTVESGHILSKHPGACRFPHGHSRTVEVVLAADGLDARDMICDFQALKLAAQEFIGRFDHSMALNTADPKFAEFRAAYGDRVIPFDNADPTTEIMARQIFQHVTQALAEAAKKGDPLYPVSFMVRVERVRVTETGTSWAEYWE